MKFQIRRRLGLRPSLRRLSLDNSQIQSHDLAIAKRTSYTWHDSTRSSPDLDGQGYPPNRCRHAACQDEGSIYVYGGRNGSVTHHDLWRYDLAGASWVKVKGQGEQPTSPQEHTIIAYKNKLYVFGGQFSYSGDRDTPLWVFDIGKSLWRKSVVNVEVLTPSGRRGHTAVLHGDVMCVYGGYVDLKGSSNEIWMLDLENEVWHHNTASIAYDHSPDGRHSHSAVLYNSAMFVYGGMTDLVARDDFWRWDFICSQWSRVKCRPNPPALKGHTACVVADQMIVYGGASHGSLLNSLWAFCFNSLTWSKLQSHGPSPLGTLQHTAVVVTTTAIHLVTKPERCRSQPHLRDNLALPSHDLNRPYSSPPKVTTSHNSSSRSATPPVFENKVSPVSDPLPYTNLLICHPVEGNTASDATSAVASDKYRDYADKPSPQTVACANEENLIDLDSQTSLEYMDTVAGCHVTSQEYMDTVAGCHVTSLEYMDTVAGCHVNQIITDVNNMLVRGKSLEHGIDMLFQKKRHRPRDQADAPIAKRTVSLENVVDDDCERGKGEHVRETCCKIADDITIEDIEDVIENESYFNGIQNQYLVNTTLLGSNDLLNSSTNSDSAFLVASPLANGQPKHSNVSRIMCFRRNIRAKSSDSLPYGMVNPLYTGYADDDLPNLVKRDQCIQVESHSKVTRNWENQENASKKPTKSQYSVLDKFEAQVMQCSQMKKDFCSLQTEFSNPTYFQSSKNSEMVEMCDLSPKKTVRGAVSQEFQLPMLGISGEMTQAAETDLGGNIDEPDVGVTRSGHQGNNGKDIPPKPDVNQTRQFVMYVMGGQTSKSRGFGFNPLQTWQLHIDLGDR